MKEAALLCPKKDLEKKPNQNKKPTTTLKAKCQAPFSRAESHQQVVVGQFCCNLVLIHPQPCYQFFHVVEKLEGQGNGSLLHKALGRASPLLQKVQLLVLEFLLLPSTDLRWSCPKGEIQKMTLALLPWAPRGQPSEQLPFCVRSRGWAGSSVLQVEGPWGKLVAVSSSSHLHHTWTEGRRETLQ